MATNAKKDRDTCSHKYGDVWSFVEESGGYRCSQCDDWWDGGRMNIPKPQTIDELSDEELTAVAETEGRAQIQRIAITAAKRYLDDGRPIPEHVLQAIVQTLPDEIVLARADQLRDTFRHIEHNDHQWLIRAIKPGSIFRLNFCTEGTCTETATHYLVLKTGAVVGVGTSTRSSESRLRRCAKHAQENARSLGIEFSL